MDSTIKFRKDMNGPLGEVTSIDGDDAHQLLFLITLQSALRFHIKTGLKISPHYSLKLVKQTTKLHTNNKSAHDDELTKMIEEQRKKVAYVEETR